MTAGEVVAVVAVAKEEAGEAVEVEVEEPGAKW